MAKPTKHASKICLALSIIAAVGIVLGLLARSPMVIVLGLAPSVAYEAYRTEGPSTRWASWCLAIVLVLQALFLLFDVNLDLAELLGYSSRYVAGYEVPLGDVKVVGPAVMAVLALVLMSRTRGRYTKWLAANIIVTSFALIYVLDHTVFVRWIQLAVDVLAERAG
ncbi:MAG TPA: hypothetical protein GX714_15285 [Chloroflexi bacterium]|jgi:hypothetical protein|nr:hypothetical protein [Chloroflexota bacterium]